MVHLYERYYKKTDFEILFNIYQKKYPLNKEELKLFFIMISIPKKIEFLNDESQKRFYQDNDIECVFVSNPRAKGHVAIITKKHFDDMASCPNRINHKIMDFAKQLMIIIKDVFECEKVYLCTMCDGVISNLFQDIHLKIEVQKTL